MAKKFIGNILILKKEVVKLYFEQNNAPSADGMQVSLSINLDDHNIGPEFSKKDEASITVLLDLSIFEASSGKKGHLANFHIEVEMRFVFLRKMTLNRSLTAEFPEELLSLVYDDFRFIVEANINRTAFQGLNLPVDFRSALSTDDKEVEEHAARRHTKRAPET